METVEVRTQAAEDGGSYKIVIGSGLISKLGSLFDLRPYTKLAVVADKNVARHWLDKLLSGLGREAKTILVPAGEDCKTIETMQAVWRDLLVSGCDRKSLIINLGGGAAGDLGGFAAATFMRGMHHLQVPTTLLAHVDASIGGKVGVNFQGSKNLIGVFAQPKGVLIDIETLATLPKRELFSGFAEVLKHGIIRDADYFRRVSGMDYEDFSSADLVQLVKTSCAIKAAVVESDEREGGLRKILNFGHTLGHAIESASAATSRPLLHGEAVSLGMIGEARISMRKGYISELEVRSIQDALDRFSLPNRLEPEVTLPAIQEHVTVDKKRAGGRVGWSLLRQVGEAIFDQEVTAAELEDAVSYLRRYD